MIINNSFWLKSSIPFSQWKDIHLPLFYQTKVTNLILHTLIMSLTHWLAILAYLFWTIITMLLVKARRAKVFLMVIIQMIFLENYHWTFSSWNVIHFHQTVSRSVAIIIQKQGITKQYISSKKSNIFTDHKLLVRYSESKTNSPQSWNIFANQKILFTLCSS